MSLHQTLWAGVLIAMALGIPVSAQAPTVTNPELVEAERLYQASQKLREQGKYAEGIPLAQQAVAIREKILGPDHPDVGVNLYNLANLNREQGNYREAEPLLKRSLSIAEKTLGPEHPDVAKNLNTLATVYREQGNNKDAEVLFQRALRIREKALGPEDLAVAKSLNNLAILYFSQGNYRDAEPLYLRSLAILEKKLGPDHPDLAFTLKNLGILYGDQGNYLAAEPLFQRALVIHQKSLGIEHPEVASDLSNLAFMFANQGNYQAAEPLNQRALNIWEKSLGLEHPRVARSLNNLGLIYSAQGNYGAAEPLFQRALSIREKVLGPMHPLIADCLYGLVDLYYAQGAYALAEPLLQRALELEEYNLSLAINTGNEQRQRDLVLAFTGSTNRALSLDLQQKHSPQIITKLALTTVLRRKGRVLDELSRNTARLRANLTPEDQQLFDALGTTRTELATLFFRGPQSKDYASQVATLNTQLKQQESALALKENRLNFISKPVSLTAVQKQIPRGMALVEFIRYQPYNLKAPRESDRLGPPRYGVYILLTTGIFSGVDLGLAATIDDAIANLRLMIGTGANAKPVARKLDQLVMAPIRKQVPSIRRWLISPDGALNLLPFAALVDEEGRYLLSKHTINYLGSGRDLLRFQPSTPAREVPLLVANPDFQGEQKALVARREETSTERSADLRDLSFATLPGTAAEVTTIHKLLPQATVLEGRAATEGVLKGVRGPSILHIATHGFFLKDLSATATENPLLRSGLVLAGFNTRAGGNGEDGALTALEASGLDLTGTQLVVLSACKTALGEINNGEGVYGLQRAFTLAGAQSQVTSLWSVDDRATQQLMVWYYQELLRGAGRSEALARAQIRILNSAQYSQPRYWAAFIPSGDWRALSQVTLK